MKHERNEHFPERADLCQLRRENRKSRGRNAGNKRSGNQSAEAGNATGACGRSRPDKTAGKSNRNGTQIRK